MNQTLRFRQAVFLSCALLFVGAAIGCPLVGPTRLSISEAWRGMGTADPEALVFFGLRIPRVAMALLSGAALSAAGAAFQALLRNPLADPFTLGVAGGSSLGAVVVLLFSPSLSLQAWAVPAAAFLGALFSVALVFALARFLRSTAASQISPLHSMVLLLSGITVNYFLSALLLVLYYLVDFTRSLSVLRWILGGLDAVEPGQLTAAFWPSVVALLCLWFLSPVLNLLTAGEDLAHSKGLDVRRSGLWVFLSASLLTSSVTAFTGPIGFIGLMIPNLLRRLLGFDHRWLLPCSALLGGAFLAVADTAARTLFAPAELPVGAITALLGGPFFLFILIQNRRFSPNN